MRRVVRWWVAAALAAQVGGLLAKSTVYESKDKAGPVFTDKPAPGAAVVDVPPPNVVESPRIAPVQPPASARPAPAYRSLSIMSPADAGTLHTNTGAFDISARISPALRAGDRIRVRLDGNLLPLSSGSPRLRVSEADWQAAADPASVEHSLQLAIVDKGGAVLIESAPVRFYVHRASAARGR
jgi:hypothetical protein